MSYEDFAVDAVSEWQPVEDLCKQTRHLWGKSGACQGENAAGMKLTKVKVENGYPQCKQKTFKAIILTGAGLLTL